jgi:alpha-galactosidase
LRSIISVLFISIASVLALDNGVARTPPMGWNAWNCFALGIDEEKIKSIADAMVSSGMKDAGYSYIVIDEGWEAQSRDADGNLLGDPTKFPNGIKALADYIHGKGLQFGIYSVPGAKAPQGNIGSEGHVQQDANTFASWDVDFLKYDACGDAWSMRDALAATARPIVLSTNGTSVADPSICNMVRLPTGDLVGCWDCPNPFNGMAKSVMGQYEAGFVQNGWNGMAQPGFWPDFDMLVVGCDRWTSHNVFPCTDEENRSHFTLWAILPAPLFAGNDLRSMSATTRDILTNKEIIALNQDMPVHPARYVWSDKLDRYFDFGSVGRKFEEIS